jgi:methenyltetrahydromethanopterin cyclohydrolase
MPAWKALFIVVFGCACLALALGTIVVPMSVDENPWLWLAGLLFATVCMGTLFTIFLKKADRTFKSGR